MGKRSKIEASEYQEVVERLIASNWSSGSIALYMGTRYQFEIDDSTVRRYKQKHAKSIEEKYKAMHCPIYLNRMSKSPA